MRATQEACLRTAELFTEIANKLTPHGLRTGFHAHEGDLLPLKDGDGTADVCAWNILAKNTPDDFILQYDTANGMAGGADPVKPILDWPGRSISVHLKAPGQEVVGESGIDWKAVFLACETVGGTQWYVVEHEDSTRMEAMPAIKLCIENLRSMK
jgi:sugar phosphate isomerase/epimerase